MRNYNCELIGKVISVEETPDSVEFYMHIDRASDKNDIIPVTISRERLGDINIEPELNVKLLGVIKTYRTNGNYKSKLRVDAINLEIVDNSVEHKNIVFGRFDVKSTKDIRRTKTGHRVKDIILKKNISEEIGVSEFRAILWNDDAEKYDKVYEGTELYIVGRLQSREYIKQTSEGTIKVRTYEVSIGKVEDDTDKYAEVVD